MITGETGTGKELVARAMHELGPRAALPFVAVNCGSLVDTLLESELFGHERGAFTDAHARRQGLHQPGGRGHAVPGRGGDADAARLRSRSCGWCMSGRSGRSAPRPSSGSTRGSWPRRTRRLDRLVQAGSFRADLYYRLCVFSVTLPPLRERREDILPLAAHFLAKHARQGSARRRELSHAAAEALLAFEWPGNVRELESAIVRAVHVASERRHRGG